MDREIPAFPLLSDNQKIRAGAERMREAIDAVEGWISELDRLAEGLMAESRYDIGPPRPVPLNEAAKCQYLMRWIVDHHLRNQRVALIAALSLLEIPLEELKSLPGIFEQREDGQE